MKTKPKDEPYCGVDENKIKSAKVQINPENFKHLVYFMEERFKIHVKKDILGEPRPWTKNDTLKTFRFTNVFREDDRQTRYLIENIINNKSLSLEDKIVNCFMFRAWNNWSTLKDFGFPYKAKKLYDPKLKEQIRPVYQKLSEDNPGRLWYSNAFNQGGAKSAWKFPAGDGYKRAYKESKAKQFPDWEKDIPLRPFHIAVWINQQNIVSKILDAKNQQECFEAIISVRGFAEFLAYQVFVDLAYIPEFPFSENEFVIAGPGCKKGLEYIFDDPDGLSYTEQIFKLREILEKTKLNELYAPYNRKINVMSLENCMCEISKYIRAVDGTGRPRNKYKPRQEEE